MKYKIGVFGSAEGDHEAILSKVHQLAEVLSKQNVIIITGATAGLPYEVAVKAHELNAEIWGYSAATDFAMQEQITPSCNSAIYTKLFYIPSDYEFISQVEVCRKYRNVSSTANADAGIIIAGRWGTLNEFTNLYDMGKVIGVLTGTGGVADELPTLISKISKDSRAVVIFHDNPEELVKNVIEELEKRK
jgi:predicted Rossmann-fold nucleotide-binding protein